VIGPSAGSCGTAAYRGEQVIVSDIVTDPLWADYRELAVAHSLRACWSTPVFSSERKVIATFAMYYREPRSPSARDQEIIEPITHLAGVPIQRTIAQERLRESEARYRPIFQWAGACLWEVDLTRMEVAVEEVRAQGVRDFRAYLTAHPDFVRRA